MDSLFAECDRDRGASLSVPTAVIAQVLRVGRRQANLRRFLADSALSFPDLDYAIALEIGTLLGKTDTADVVDGCVVVCAQRRGGCPVITSDPADLRRLDRSLPLITV